MSSDKKKTNGKIVWQDLTVANAAEIGEFYRKVTGWESSPVSMGEYNDFNMVDPQGDVVAGICHARGGNKHLPPQWLIYIKVASVRDAVSEAEKAGGEILDGPRPVGESVFCVIRDPAGACFAVID